MGLTARHDAVVLGCPRPTPGTSGICPGHDGCGGGAGHPSGRVTGQVSLKWPNDVMIGGGKAAGILAEGSRGHVVVGCGINVTVAEAICRSTTATSLSLHAAPADRSALLVAALHPTGGGQRAVA